MSGHPVDDLAVHAVGALPAGEAPSVEAHLARCGACRRELAEHLTTLAALTGEAAPPPWLWPRIAARLGAEPVHPVALADRRRPPTRRGWSVARVAAAIVLVVALGASLGRLAGPGEAPTDAERAEAALEDPDAAVTRLDDPATGAPAARFVVAPDGDAYVTLDDLAPLAADRTYQLWRTETTTPVSLGVLGSGRARAVEVQVPPGRARLAISQEPAGGSPVPTGTLVAAGTVG